MISRVTVFSLLLALMLGAGIRLWDAQQRDPCSLYMAGDKTLPSSEYVISGTRQIVVPCTNWFLRQPLHIQILCLFDITFAIICVFNALADLKRWFEMRRRMRRLS